MPPQSNTPTQVPGSDVLLETLKNSKITDDQRQQIWDAYHTPGEEKDFIGGLNKLSVGDDVKQTLYDMRYKGFKNPGNQATPQAPAPTAQPPKAAEPSSLKQAGTAIGSDVLGAIQGIAKSVPGMDTATKLIQGDLRGFAKSLIPGGDAGEKLQQLKDIVSGDTERKKAGYSPVYRGAAAIGQIAGVVDPKGMEEEAAKGHTAGVLGHMVVPTIGALLMGRGGKEITERGIAKGPIEGGPIPEGPGTVRDTAQPQRGPEFAEQRPYTGTGLSRENVAKLKSLGYTNDHISTMNTADIQRIIGGNIKAPVDLQGAKGPLRPYDPSGTRFAKGGTIGMEPLDAEQLIAPTPKAPVTKTEPTGDWESRSPEQKQYDIISALLDLKDNKHPGIVGAPIILPGGSRLGDSLKFLSVELDKNQEYRIADTPQNNMVRNQLITMLEGMKITAPPPKGPATYTPSEKAATMAAPRPSLGPEFEAQQASHDLERNKRIIRDTKASSEDKRVAQSRIDEGIPTPPQPVNRGTEAGVTPSDPYYKPPPGNLVPSSEVEPPKLEPVPEPTKSIVPYSHELPAHIQDDLDLMVRSKKLATEAPSEETRTAAQNVWNEVAGRTKTDLQDHFNKLTPEQLIQLKSDQESKAERHQKQSHAISDIIAGDKIAQAVRGELAVGEPVVSSHHAVDQYSQKTGKPIVIVGGTPMDLRSVMSDALGRVVKYESDPVFAAQRAKAVEQGLDPDTIQPEGYKRVPPEKFSEMVLTAKTELQGLQDGFKAKLKELVTDRLDKNPSLIESLGAEGAHENVHAQALKELLHEVDATGKTLTEKIKGLRELIGRDPQKPVYVKKGEPIIEGGVVKAPGTIPAKSLKIWNAITGKKNNKIGTDAQFQAEADKHMEKSRLHRAIARGVAAFLDVKPPKGGQGGFIGEATPPTKAVSRSDITEKDLDPIRMLAKAKEAGLEGHQVTDEQPAGDAGFLSPDGKVWIAKGDWDHDDVADMIFPGRRNPMWGMLNGGWLRKAGSNNYQVEALTQRAIDTIEMDMIRNRATSLPLYIDARLRPNEKLNTLQIDPGVDDIGKAIAQERRRILNSIAFSQAGTSGVALTAGMGLGGVVGTVAGAIHGGVTGAIVGGTMGMAFGFLAPAVLTSLPVRNAMKVMGNIVRGAGVSIKTWLQGPPQVDITGISPEMDRIMREQRLHNEPETTWLERAKLLPSAIYKGIDPAAYIADKKNMSMTGKIMMSLDPKGRVFRDLDVPDTASLYQAVFNARADALGLRADKGMQYSAIKSDANKAGVRPMLTAYLNLAAYKRANEVVQEHIQDLQAQEQNIQTKLQSPSNSIRQTIALKDDLKDVQTKQKELSTRLQSGKVTPGGFNLQKIQDTVDQLRSTHPLEMQQVEQLAKQVFAIRANILDLLLDNGIISQDAYVTYKSRGDEYIPMRRIMDDLEPQDYTVNVSPLDLKQQSVIKMLEGSERENLDPWEALDGDDKRAFNNIIRNGVMKKLLDLAAAYPNTVGQELTPVQPDYRPKKDEMILGHYENGKPNLFAVPKYLGDTLKAAPLATEMGFTVLSHWLEHTFKKGATIYKIAFLATSTLTHALTSMMLSKYGAPPIPTEVAKFINDWRKAAIEVYKNGPAYRELVKGGASFGGFDQLFSPERFISPDEMGIKSRLKKGQILDTMADFAVAAENANRTNILMRGLKQGATLQQALFEARQFGGAPNFSRMGILTKGFNHAFMFINAHMQYPFQTMAGIRKNPARVYPWIAVITAMSMAILTANLMYQDSKGISTYRKISTYDRERNYVVMTPWTYGAKTGARLPIALKIPKPFLVQQIINPMEEAMTYYAGQDVRTGKQQALDAIAALSPIHLNLKEGHLGGSVATSIIAASHPLAKTGIEQYSNLDDFGRPIVPPKQGVLSSEFQTSPYTPAITEQMGKGGLRGAEAGGALGATVGSMFGPAGAVLGGAAGAGAGAIGISPRRLDTGLRSMTGSMGTQAETMLDPFFGGTSKRRQLEGTEKAISTPIIGGLARGFMTSPVDAEFQALSERFYTVYQAAETIKANFDYLIKIGKGAEAAKYAQDHQAEISRALVLRNLYEPIKNLNEKIYQLQSTPFAQTGAGRKAIEQMYEVRTNLMRTAQDLLNSPTPKTGDTSPMGGSITSTNK